MGVGGSGSCSIGALQTRLGEQQRQFSTACNFKPRPLSTTLTLQVELHWFLFFRTNYFSSTKRMEEAFRAAHHKPTYTQTQQEVSVCNLMDALMPRILMHPCLCPCAIAVCRACWVRHFSRPHRQQFATCSYSFYTTKQDGMMVFACCGFLGSGPSQPEGSPSAARPSHILLLSRSPPSSLPG